MAIQAVVLDREYSIVNGPGKLSMASSLLESDTVQFTTKQMFGETSKEIWRVEINSVTRLPQKNGIYDIRGIIFASGPTASRLIWKAEGIPFSGRYDIRKRKGGMTATIELPM